MIVHSFRLHRQSYRLCCTQKISWQHFYNKSSVLWLCKGLFKYKYVLQRKSTYDFCETKNPLVVVWEISQYLI